MTMKVRTIPAGEFKARCLAILDEVEATGETIVITKRGKAVARLLPPEPAEDAKDRIRAAFSFIGDIESTAQAWAEWDPEQEFRP